MTQAIQQSVRFRATPQTLFNMYLDSRKHTESTGAPAKLSKKEGRSFSAFGGKIEGKNLLIVPGKRVVQHWRATHWKKGDWSVLILDFNQVAGGSQIDLVHASVPTYDHKGVREGWPKYYWRPWKRYLRNR